MSLKSLSSASILIFAIGSITSDANAQIAETTSESLWDCSFLAS